MRPEQIKRKPVPVEISPVDTNMVVTIKRILAKGNHAEVKAKTDGSYTIYEVKKSLV